MAQVGESDITVNDAVASLIEVAAILALRPWDSVPNPALSSRCFSGPG